MIAFVHDTSASRVVFAVGALDRVVDEVERLGARRVMLVSGAHEAPYAQHLERQLGPRLVAQFTDVRMHVPAAVAERAVVLARDSGADCLLALGGGSATGTAKAVAKETGLPILAVPTTYAGSELTSIWGLTEHGRKVTGRDPRVLPRTVVYDPALTVSLPTDVSAASGMNALAHLVEGLYSPGLSPVTARQAEEGIRALAEALPRVVADPSDLGARGAALYGAWLAGRTLGATTMGVHHRICHVLGGAFDLPHAQTHSAVLPSAVAFNADAAPTAMAAVVRALRAAGTDAEDAASGLWDLAARIGAPTSLAGLGFRESGIQQAAELVVAGAPVNPRPLEVAGVADLLRAATRGDRPAIHTAGPMSREQLTREVVRRIDAAADPRLREVMQALVRHLHAFATQVRLTDEEWQVGIEFLTATGQLCNDRRQEFILLSDTLGLSSLVDLINHATDDPGATGATEATVHGPFYVPGSPYRQFGESMVEYDDGGEPAVVRGRVLDAQGRPIPGAVLDVWQNAATGFYAVQQPDEQPATNLRGRYRSDELGRYEFRTVRPVPYPIPADGPVGRLLKDTGRHEWRAAHIHLRAEADGYRTVWTHVFDRSSDYLDSDTVFGVKDSLIADFVPGPDGVLVCEWDVVLVRPESPRG